MERHASSAQLASQPALLQPLPERDLGDANNLPAPLTTLIGRDAEIAAAGTLLQRDDVRLITLTGPGGVGKTQLALALARRMSHAFAEGAVFVSLAPLNDPALVVPAIAQAVGIRDSATRPLVDTLRDALRDRELLLLLDNFEHVTSAAPLVVDLLTACPALKVLVTSRELLHLTGEQVFVVPPLDLPEPGHASSLADLTNAAAIRLFLTRARAAQPDFALTAANAGAVSAICRALDGLPLALELAATRVRVMTPQALLAQLSSRLPLLTGGHRDAPERLQTLRNAIAWSYGLLTCDEQRLFRRLSVFVGGFALEGAEAISTGEPALDLLTSLVDKSLIQQGMQPDGETRFTMLETIREFGLEQLAPSGEEDAARDAHAAYLLDLTEEADPHFWGSNEPLMMDRYEIEHPNVRAALDWLEKNGQIETALRLMCRQRFVWQFRGRFVEAGDWLERLIARGDDVALGVRAKALTDLGEVVIGKGDLERAQALCEEALSLAREAGDRRCAAEALRWLGEIAWWRRDFDLAEELTRQALANCTDGEPLAKAALPPAPEDGDIRQWRLLRFDGGMTAMPVIEEICSALMRSLPRRSRVGGETTFQLGSPYHCSISAASLCAPINRSGL
jgi:predicted ATPase